MARFKTEEQTETGTETPARNVCPKCKHISIVSFPVFIYYGPERESDLVCHVNKCYKCNEILSFYTYDKDGVLTQDESKFNLPKGFSMLSIKMLLNGKYSTTIDFKDLRGSHDN